MDLQTLQERKNEIIARWGPWTAHNIRLNDDVYTMDRKVKNWSGTGQELRLIRIMQIIRDFCHGPVDQLSILDLGCLEGLFAIEFGLQGARVLGIEGWEANIAKARFAKEALKLDNVHFSLDDVRNLTREKYGHFDVVLCLGILYHLDVPDALLFMKNVADVTHRLAVIDTQISLSPKQKCIHAGKTYWGRTYREVFGPQDRGSWSSIGNEKSFWFTRPSLYNLTKDVGFNTIYECASLFGEDYDRLTLVAVKADMVKLQTNPLVNHMQNGRWPESRGSIHPINAEWWASLIPEISHNFRRILAHLQ